MVQHIWGQPESKALTFVNGANSNERDHIPPHKSETVNPPSGILGSYVESTFLECARNSRVFKQRIFSGEAITVGVDNQGGLRTL